MRGNRETNGCSGVVSFQVPVHHQILHLVKHYADKHPVTHPSVPAVRPTDPNQVNRTGNARGPFRPGVYSALRSIQNKTPVPNDTPFRQNVYIVVGQG